MSDTEKKIRRIKVIYDDNIIKVDIPNNYEEALEEIRKALYLKKEEMDLLDISFMDSEGDENYLEEDNFDEAFESEKWFITKNYSIPK